MVSLVLNCMVCTPSSVAPSSTTVPCPKTALKNLYGRRVKHDSDGSTKALGREVRSELGADDTAVAVRACDFLCFR